MAGGSPGAGGVTARSVDGGSEAGRPVDGGGVAGWPVGGGVFARPPGADAFDALRGVPARIDLSPGVPDLTAFPRAAWLRAERAVLRTLSASDFGARRRELMRWAEAGGLVIEDDCEAEHRYDRPPAPALRSMLPERVCYAGSVSKVLTPHCASGGCSCPTRIETV
ncbi:hypothetical protein [Saccharothrix luteola]|uniref:hypothetical protein n=1 Tax=Saccharothrix luteola TaxID=2893018 RepID=UPI001E642165|nr:hypothetical protein [Saccharothrix luteola]MCC8251592.1 hypothetical protein [Saccharothrix luteola]